MKKKKHRPQSGGVRKPAEKGAPNLKIVKTAAGAPGKPSPETVAGILKCRRAAKWLYIACYPVFLAFSLALGSSSGIAIVITLVALYALAVFAARYTLRLYRLMHMKYNPASLVLSVIIPPSSAYYIIAFLRDSREYLRRKLSEKELAGLHISF